MGFIKLDNGEVVHMSYLNPNPVISIETMETKTVGNVTFVIQNYVHKDGKKENVTLTYTSSTC
jgi:hypothetical protein